MSSPAQPGTRTEPGCPVIITAEGSRLPIGTLGTVTEVGRPWGSVPHVRVDFHGCTHVWNNGRRGIWVDEPSLERLHGPLPVDRDG